MYKRIQGEITHPRRFPSEMRDYPALERILLVSDPHSPRFLLRPRVMFFYSLEQPDKHHPATVNLASWSRYTWDFADRVLKDQ